MPTSSACRLSTSIQGGQGEPATPGTHQHALAIDLKPDIRFGRQALGNIHQLACRHRGFTRLHFPFQRQASDQLQFQVRARHGKLPIAHFQQHIGEHRQGLTFFHHRSHLLQGLEELFSID